jgi:hypothetical protein
MALIRCPECSNTLSDSAPGCPKCGYKLTPEYVAAQKEKAAKQKTEEDRTAKWVAIVMGSVVLIGTACYLTGGKSASNRGWDSQNMATREIEAKQLASSNGKAASYQDNLARHHQLGEQRNPSQAELREYLMLDARLSVKEGQMSVSDFERWTGERY